MEQSVPEKRMTGHPIPRESPSLHGGEEAPAKMAIQKSRDGFESLVDPRFGILRSLEILPAPDDLPPAFYRAHAEIADSSRFAPWNCDLRAGGCAWNQPQAARCAAGGEAVERYCGNLVSSALRRATYDQLRSSGDEAVDPGDLALFSAEQYALRGFPFVPFTSDLPVLWVRGHNLLTGRPVWVPASLVWVTFFTGSPGRGEPHTHPVPYAGIAAGTDRETALESALFELIERDAVHLSWHRGDALPRLDPPSWLRRTVEGGAVQMELYQFPNDFGVPVVGALAFDRQRDLLALGLAARRDPLSAALKAAAEGIQLLVASRTLDDPESSQMRQVACGAPGLGLKPWRADRAYRRLYREDWRDAWDLLCHLQLYQDPAMRRPLEQRLSGGPTRPLESLPSVDSEHLTLLQQLIQRLAQRGHEAVEVDVTTPDVRQAGLRVLRVIAPGLYGNGPAAYPYLGGPRLATAREAQTICRLPLPYA